MIEKRNRSELLTFGFLALATFAVVKGVVETEKLAEAAAVSPVDEVGILMTRDPELLAVVA
jgi:hypothetical protein